ncbi:MAG: tRNA 2-thiouridine(34) synthase MnmA [Deltaproteobacteria bacterium]|nr:tRNA 2-thiouridine(34) synthase MnmA [Deltaproteobacteria bacterium]
MKRVVVAMSGGVDSSVAACLLADQGFEVIGISLKLWEGEKPAHGRTCCSFEDIRDARSVCESLGISFYAFNYKKEFKERVVDPFARDYFAGLTPNPCISCNNHVKFDLLLKEALELGADYLATGHYARIQNQNGVYRLLKARAEEKDQSYVLYQLGQDVLKKVLFPIGELSKEEVREIARKKGIITADKRESMDVCFIPTGDRTAFMVENYPGEVGAAGNFVDKNGKVLGRHEGIHAYTVGQRRGLKIGFGERLYVTQIRPEKNEIELGLRSDLQFAGLVASDVHWVIPPLSPLDCGVKIRYQKGEIPSRISMKGDEAVVTFHSYDLTSPAVTPGQAAVFYRGDEVLGGGRIKEALESHPERKRRIFPVCKEDSSPSAQNDIA